MKALLLAIVCAVLAGTGAQASILTLYMFDSYNQVLSPQPVQYWSGPYAGGHLSATWASFDPSDISVSTPGGLGSFSAGQFQGTGPALGGGVDVGYNVTSSGAVVGIEGDLSYSHFSVSKSFSATDVPLGGDTLSGKLAISHDVAVTVRGRVGLLMTPQTLLYATGGFALARARGIADFVYDNGKTTTGTASGDTLAAGWVIGAGIEDNFIDNMSAKIEYLFIYYPSTQYTLSGSGMTFSYKGSTFAHQVRAGLNFKF